MQQEAITRVLLVEDDSDCYRLICKSIHKHSSDVMIDWAESCGDAVEKLDASSYDVILSDLSLPDSVGLETVARLKAQNDSLPVIVLTSLDDVAMEQDILEAGAQDYLVKGENDGRAMLRAIHHAIQRQQMQNELRLLCAQRERDQRLLQEQADLLRKKNQRLKRLYKTSQEFVDNVSHDFRTPLTVIKDYVSIVREGMLGDINQEQRAMLDKVSVRADDLNYMVDDLLDVSKLESGLLGAWRRKTSVQAILDRVESMLRQRAQIKNVDFRIDRDDDLPNVYCDSDLVGRVITNLAVNAIKFCDKGGRVRLHASADFDRRHAVLSVTDNGPGIDEDSLKRIFKRFRQAGAQGKTKGYGLGLDIANQLCKINLGEMSVQSRVGEGSTFSFTIPFAEPLEVLSRWLRKIKPSADAMSITEIGLAGEQTPASADEFDYFLNCQLRKHDLLFRVSPTRWLFIMVAPASELDCWRQRMRREFRKANRNRPMGPLPQYQTVLRGRWLLTDKHAGILEESARLLEEYDSVGVPV